MKTTFLMSFIAVLAMSHDPPTAMAVGPSYPSVDSSEKNADDGDAKIEIEKGDTARADMTNTALGLDAGKRCICDDITLHDPWEVVARLTEVDVFAEPSYRIERDARMNFLIETSHDTRQVGDNVNVEVPFASGALGQCCS